MATIVTRSGKGSALTFVEADANFTNLNNDKMEFVADDSAPALGGNLDVGANQIITSTTNGSIILTPNGTGQVKALGELDLVGGTLTTSTTDGDININANGEGMININGSSTLAYIQSHREALQLVAPATGTVGVDPSLGPIAYLVLSGNITINGLANSTVGQTVTMLIDGSGGSFTLTLGAGILVPGGTAALTDGGYDLLTLTHVDDSAGDLYIGTIVNDFAPTV
jgi:hypothetical protein